MPMSLPENLKILGLTEYETKAYISLVKHGELTAKTLSDKSEVPYSKTYEITSNLEKKGLIEVQKGRPMVFRAAPPKTALMKYVDNFTDELKNDYFERRENLDKSHSNYVSKITSSLDEASNMLQSFYEDRGGVTASDDLIWTIRGKENVVSQVMELIKKSKSVKMIMHEELINNIGD